jgi:hypothetical protein
LFDAVFLGLKVEVLGLVMTSQTKLDLSSNKKRSYKRILKFDTILSNKVSPPLPPHMWSTGSHKTTHTLKQPAEQWVSFDESGIPTSENTGYSLNWGIKTDLRQKRINQEADKIMKNYSSPLFIFVVVMSGGESPLSLSEKIKMDQQGRKARNCGMRTVVKFVMLNGDSSPLSFPLGVSISKSLQTVEHYSPTYGIYGMSRCIGSIPAVTAKHIADAVFRVLGLSNHGKGTVTVGIDRSEQRVGLGFVDTLIPSFSSSSEYEGTLASAPGWDHQPKWFESFPNVSPSGNIDQGVGTSNCLLYCGKPPRALRINGDVFAVNVVENSELWDMHDVEMQLAALRKVVNSIQVWLVCTC